MDLRRSFSNIDLIKPELFNERLVIQEQTRLGDSSGGFDLSWSTLSTVWGRVEPLSASQRFFSSQLQHRVSHKIFIRYLSTVTSEMRISWASRIFQIRGILNVNEKNRFMILECEEGAAS